jgi:uncharacterized membrane protein YjdF
MSRDRALVLIGVVTSIAIVAIAATAVVATYRVNPVFLIPLTWLPYYFRRGLHLRRVPYAMFCAAILLHDLGAYGFYQRSPLPFSFDIAVHYYFAVPCTLMLYDALAGHLPTVPRWRIAIAAGMFMMGLGALHEIMEYGTYLVLGEEKGMLKPSTSYVLDTQRDLTNNLAGTLTALVLAAVLPASRTPANAPTD